MQTQINVPYILEQLKIVGDSFLTGFKRDPIPSNAETLGSLFAEIENKALRGIQNSLTATYPDIAWVTDEFDMEGQKSGVSVPEYWLFDSMDGAVQYMQHLPGWTFNLVLVRNNEPYLAAVYNPLDNEMFWAVAGEGAYLNDKAIHPTIKADTSLTLATFNHPPFQNKFEGLNEIIGKSIEKLLTTFGAVRNYGPLGLMLCSIAAGRTDVFFQYGLDTYNWLAGILIAKEAGALILTAQGAEWTWGAESLLVTAQALPPDFFNEA
jgi:myo-inositol-1(or 4)-monophosphatase